jgi:hypothetical protein
MQRELLVTFLNKYFVVSLQEHFLLLIPMKVPKKFTWYYFHFLKHLPHIADFDKGHDEQVEWS